MKKRNRYGTPMDNRADYTKPEWIVWCASLANTTERFAQLVDPIWDFANETKDRVPLADWFMTPTAKHCGMHARSVVGGVYAPWYLAQRGAWLPGN